LQQDVVELSSSLLNIRCPRSRGGWTDRLPSTITGVFLGSRLGAPLVAVTLLVTVGTLNTGPVSGLGTLTAGVTELVAVAALDLGHVARLRALLGNVALLVAVTAGDDALFFALLGPVTLLATVAADVRLAVRAIVAEVAHLVTVLAFDVVHVARLRAFLGHVTFLAAVATAATTTLLRWLLAVTSTVAGLVTVDAHLDRLLDLTLLLLAVGCSVARLLAVATDGNEAVHWEASLTKAVDVLLWGGRPPLGEDGTLRLGGPLDGDSVLLIRLALEVDQSPVYGDVLLPGDQVGVELVAAEGLLEVLQGRGTNSLGIDEEGLWMSVNASSSIWNNVWCMAHLLDLEGVLLLIGGLESLPSLVGGHVTNDAVQGEQAVGLARGGNMASLFADAAHFGLLLGAVCLAVAGLATAATLSAELALDSWVRAIGLVVSGLVAVVAETGIESGAAPLWLLGAIASKVGLRAAAVLCQP